MIQYYLCALNDIYETNETWVFDNNKFKIFANEQEQEKILEKTDELFGCKYTYELKDGGGFFIIITSSTLMKIMDKLYI